MSACATPSDWLVELTTRRHLALESDHVTVLDLHLMRLTSYDKVVLVPYAFLLAVFN